MVPNSKATKRYRVESLLPPSPSRVVFPLGRQFLEYFSRIILFANTYILPLLPLCFFTQKIAYYTHCSVFVCFFNLTVHLLFFKKTEV